MIRFFFFCIKDFQSIKIHCNERKAWNGSVLLYYTLPYCKCLWLSVDRFSKVQVTFRARKLFYVCQVCIQDQSCNNFENDQMKLLVNEAKLTDLWARNCATIQQVLILMFALGPEKSVGVSRNGPSRAKVIHLYNMVEYSKVKLLSFSFITMCF